MELCLQVTSSSCEVEPQGEERKSTQYLASLWARSRRVPALGGKVRAPGTPHCILAVGYTVVTTKPLRRQWSA